MSAKTEALAPTRPGRPLARAWRVVLIVLSVGVGFYGLSYLTGRPAPPGVAQNHAGIGLIVVHATCAGVALLLGPWQFVASIRARRPWLHRWIGRAYLTVSLVGGLTGLVLGWNVSSGNVARWGFMSLAVIWLATSALGYAAALRRDFVSHRRWMIRSFALTFAAVTLRLYLPIILVPGVSFAVAYPIIAWACWVPNLALAEAWLRTRLAAAA